MDERNTDSDNRRQLRRKLLRGSFSVPAVLAVHNGSALAATSSAQACAVKSIADRHAVPAPGAAGWASVAYHNDGASPPKQWVLWNDLTTLAAASGVGLAIPAGANSGYIEYVAGGAYQFGAPVGSVATAEAGTVPLVFHDNGDGTVTIVGLVQPGTTGFNTGSGVVSGSCWSSLRP